jgi:hypothetical protein
MAYSITYTDLDPTNNLVTKSSRYVDSDVIYYGPLNKLTFTIYKRTNTPQSNQDMFMIIGAGTEYRPDLVSKKMYGTVDFWWKILEANGMKDIMEFKSGTNIRLPYNIY